MKPIFPFVLLAFCAIVSLQVTAQTNYYWNVTSGNFNTLSNWRTDGFGGSVTPTVIPSKLDSVIIGNGSTSTTLTINVNDTIKSLSILGSGQVFINTSNSSVLYLLGNLTSTNTNTTGGGSASLKLCGTSAERVTGGSTNGVGKLPNLSLAPGTGGSVTFYNYITMGGSTVLNLISGPVTCDASSVINFYFGNTITGSWTFRTVEFQGTGSTFTLSNNITVTDSLRITQSSTYAINGSTLNLGGDLKIWNTSGGGGGSTIINLNGSGKQTIFSHNTAEGKAFLGTVRINKTGDTLHLHGVISVAAEWSNNSAFKIKYDTTSELCFYLANSTCAVGGTYPTPIYKLAFGAGKTVSLSNCTYNVTCDSAFIVEDSFKMVNNLKNCGVNNHSIVVNGNIYSDVGSGGGSCTFFIKGTKRQTINSHTAIGGGTLPNVVIQKSGGSLRLFGTITVSGNWTNNFSRDSILPGTSEVYMVIANATCSIGGTYPTPFYKFDVGGANTTYAFGIDSAVIVKNTFWLKAGGSYGLSGHSIAVYGDILHDVGGGGPSTPTEIFVKGGNNQTITGPSSGAGWFPSITIQKTAGTLSLAGIIAMTGNWMNNYSTSQIVYGTAEIFTGFGSAITWGGTHPTPIYDLVINATPTTFTLGHDSAFIVKHMLNMISSPYGINMTGGSFVLEGNIENDRTIGASFGNTWIIGGGNNQTLAGSSGISIATLQMKKTVGTFTISQPLTVTSSLAFTKGIIKDSATLVTLNNGATVSGASDSGFVSGPVKKVGNQAFHYPIGKGSHYNAMAISAPSSTSDAFTAEYFNKKNTNTTLDGVLTYTDPCEYWNLAHPAGSSSVHDTLFWNSPCFYIPNLNYLKVGYVSGSTWTNSGTCTTSGSTTSGKIASPAGILGDISLAKNNVLVVAHAGSDVAICNGSTTTIGASPAGTGGTGTKHYAWIPATGLSSSTAANPTASPTTTTTYIVTVTDSISEYGKDTIVATVNPLPGNNAGSNLAICNGSNHTIGASSTSGHTYSWSPVAGLSSSTVSNSTASSTTTTTYTLTETITATGCSVANSITVTVNPLPGNNTGGNQSICYGLSISIGDVNTSGHTYSWSPATGLNASTVSNPIASPTATKTYTLTETTEVTGCSISDSIVLTVNQNPAAHAGNDTTIINGSKVTLGKASGATGGTSPYSYLWTPTNGLAASTTENPLVSPSITTSYILNITDQHNCVNNDTIVINNTGDINPCLFDSIWKKSIAQSGYLDVFEQREQLFRSVKENSGFRKFPMKLVYDPTLNDNVYLIPVVVFIVFDNVHTSESDVSVNQVTTAIHALNRHFAPSHIQFCLATKDISTGQDFIPELPTDPLGVFRIQNPSTNSSNLDFNYQGNGYDQDANMKGIDLPSSLPDLNYLKIFVVNQITDYSNSSPTQVIGYSYIPAQGPSSNGGGNAITDGVVIDRHFFGSEDPQDCSSCNFNLNSNYNLGKALTHYVGHYLNVFHPFDDGWSACNLDCSLTGDRCCDIPTFKLYSQYSQACDPSSYGVDCSNNPFISYTYLDFLYDECRDKFTDDQSDRLSFCLDYVRPTLPTVSNLISTGVSCLSDYVYIETTSGYTTFCAGQPATFFTSQSLGVIWDFGDGSSTVNGSSSVTHTYSQTGSYIVSLTTSNASATLKIFVVNCPNNMDKQKGNWYFGNNANLSFTNGNPMPSPGYNSQMETQEGCFSVSDKIGNVLFYSNGIKAWDKNDNILTFASTNTEMDDLSGDCSSSQSALAVLNPANWNQYYLFTVPSWESINANLCGSPYGSCNTGYAFNNTASSKLSYTKIDIDVSGKASVASSLNENIPLQLPTTSGGTVAEQISSTSDGAGGYWIIVHGSINYTSYTRAFLVYHLTTTGAITGPSVYDFPSSSSTIQIGQIKISPDGNYIAIVGINVAFNCSSGGILDDNSRHLEVYHFNHFTGAITSYFTDNIGSYGLSFSPNSGFLYVQDHNPVLFTEQIWQYDVSLGASSKILVANLVDVYSSLQLGPDNQLYIALRGLPYLAVIHYPDIANNTSNACGFDITGSVPAVSNTPWSCTSGLPNLSDGAPGTPNYCEGIIPLNSTKPVLLIPYSVTTLQGFATTFDNNPTYDMDNTSDVFVLNTANYSAMVFNQSMSIDNSSPSTFTFKNTILEYANGVGWTISNNATINNLIFDGDLLEAGCDHMWAGIINSASSCTINVTNGTTIQDAIIAVTSNNGGVIKVTNSTFDKNLTALFFENNTSGTTNQSNIKGTTFTCSGSLLPPYSQYATEYYAININGLSTSPNSIVNNLQIGDDGSGGYTNHFDHFIYGIYSKNCRYLTIYNNDFDNPSSFPYTSYGVYANYLLPVNFIINTKTTIGGNGTNQSNEFECSYGIELTKNEDADIINNVFNSKVIHSTTGIWLNGVSPGNSVKAATGLYNFNITDNRFNWVPPMPSYRWQYGIRLYEAYGNAYIYNNLMNYADSGIDRINIMPQKYITNIVYNLILNTFNGITIQNQYKINSINSTSVLCNQIYQKIPHQINKIEAAYGIEVRNCQGPTLINNSYVGEFDYTSGTYAGSIGYYLSHSPNSMVCNNSAQQCERGIQCANPMSQSFFIKNCFTYDNYGVVLKGKQANIGWQGFPHYSSSPGTEYLNYWYGFDGTTGIFHSLNDGALTPKGSTFFTEVAASPFNLSPGTNGAVGSLPQPFLALAPVQFISAYSHASTLLASGKASSVCDHGCSSYGYRTDMTIIEYDTSGYNLEVSAMDTDWVKRAIVDTSEYDIDSSGTISSDETNFFTLRHYFEKQNLYVQAKTDSGFTYSDSALLNSFMDSTQYNDIGKIEAAENQLGLYMSGDTTVVLGDIEDIVNSISGSLIPSQNSKEILDIYLRIFITDSTILDSTDYASLFNIAIQCPWEGGKAVYLARTMLEKFDTAIVYYAQYCEDIDTTSARVDLNKSVKNLSEIKNNFLIYPNPAYDNINIAYRGANENTWVTIYDLLGMRMDRIKLEKGNGIRQYSTSNLSSGMYFYTVIGLDDSDKKEGKIIIEK